MGTQAIILRRGVGVANRSIPQEFLLGLRVAFLHGLVREVRQAWKHYPIALASQLPQVARSSLALLSLSSEPSHPALDFRGNWGESYFLKSIYTPNWNSSRIALTRY